MKPLPLAAILAGGKSRRMGSDKVMALLAGTPLLERVCARLQPITERVIVVGGKPQLDGAGIPTVPDRFPGADSMGGIATSLAWAAENDGPDAWVLCVACDMPFLDSALLIYLAGLRGDWDVVVPRTVMGFEPLCCFYRATCLEAFREEIGRGNLRVKDIYAKVRTREVGEEELRRIDPELRSFLNINRPNDLETAARLLREGVLPL